MVNKALSKAIYCDSCVFISYISGTPGRIDTLDDLFDSIHEGSTEPLIYSTVTITEVAYAAQEKDQRALRPGIMRLMDQYGTMPDLIKIVEYNSFVARIARNLIRDSMINQIKGHSNRCYSSSYSSLDGSNGITVTNFFTYDQGLINNGPFFHLQKV